MIYMKLDLPVSGNSRNAVFTSKLTGKTIYKRKPETQAFFDHVAYEFIKSKRKGIKGILECNVIICASNTKRDADNVLKTLFDALESAGVIENDKLIKKCTYIVVNEPGRNEVHVYLHAMSEPPRMAEDMPPLF